MKATEARRLATEHNDARYAKELREVLAKIEQEAKVGKFSMTFGAVLPAVKTSLEDRGYTVKVQPTHFNETGIEVTW